MNLKFFHLKIPSGGYSVLLNYFCINDMDMIVYMDMILISVDLSTIKNAN